MKYKNKDSERFEKSEDATKYGEFMSSYFAWIPIPKQKERAEELANMTQTENKKQKNEDN